MQKLRASRPSAVAWLFCLLSTILPFSNARAEVIYETGFEEPTFTAGADNLVDTDGWTGSNTGSGESGILADGAGFGGQGQAAYIGFNAPPNPEDVYAWKQNLGLDDPLGDGKEFVNFSVDIAIIESENGQNDTFSFTAYNTDVFVIAGVDFNTGGSNTIRNAVTGDASTFTFAYSTQYKLQININFSTNKWSATLDTDILFDNVDLAAVTTYNLADIDAVWALSDPDNPGDNFMIFDNYSIMAIPEPSTVAMALFGAALIGVTMRRRRNA